jgi:hypothetical protein
MTDQTPQFFVPNVAEDHQERAYETLAKACGQRAVAPDQRIYSIVYIHDGVRWTATVGQQLHGTKTTIMRGRERRAPRSDSATVLAIFQGNPYRVVTSAPPFGNTRSEWANPFMAGQPEQVTLFRQASN